MSPDRLASALAVESLNTTRMEFRAQLTQVHIQLRQLRRSQIQLLVLLDQTLRVLRVNLCSEHLYTDDLDEDIKLRLELCKTIARDRTKPTRRLVDPERLNRSGWGAPHR